MRKNYLSEFSADEIIAMLKHTAWRIPDQTVSSASTNTMFKDSEQAQFENAKKHPKENTSGVVAFSDIPFIGGIMRVLDVGGGQSDQNKDYMARTKGVELLVWDPFNRSDQHNKAVKRSIKLQLADAATSMSILNVIPNIEARLAHITTVMQATKVGGFCYFKVWSGEGENKGTGVAIETSEAYQANAPAKRFLNEIRAVFGLENVYLDEMVQNLIVAKKCTDNLPAVGEIEKIRTISSFMDKPTVNNKHFTPMPAPDVDVNNPTELAMLSFK